MRIRKNKWFWHTCFWIGVYLALALGPLVVLLFVGTRLPGRPFWIEFSVCLGFAGMAMMAAQFLLTARIPHASAPFGMDILYHFHRRISYVALVLILAHPIILFVAEPGTLRLLNPVEAPWRARFAVVAVVLLVALVVTSAWRSQLRLNYEVWRILHNLLAVLVLVFATAHIIGVGHYVGEPGTRGLWIAMSLFWVAVLFYIRVWKPLLMVSSPWRIAEVRPERGQAWTIALEPDGHEGIEFKPGQFAWITLRSSPFAIREHPFSIASSASHPDRIEFTIKELGDFTRTIGKLKPGEKAYLDGPYGSFTYKRFHGNGYGFIAGGIGITPFMSMLRTMADRGETRPLLLLYGNERWEDVTFREELEKLKERLNLTVVHLINEPPEDWEGEKGFIRKEVLEKHFPRDGSAGHFFICGPVPMIDAAESALADLGVPISHVHSERFHLV